MKIKNPVKKILFPLAFASVLPLVENINAGPVLVDSYLGGSLNSTAPFGGLTAVTPNWQNLGGIFAPNQNSQLTEFDVSIFTESGATGDAQLTIFQYNQPVGYATYVNIGPTLGSAEVPVSSSGGLGGLVAFNFSSQNIQLQAGQTYAFMLSNPDSTSLSPAWRLVDYTSSSIDINSEDQFTSGGFDYASVVAGASPHYEAFANPAPVPEPGSLTFVGAALAGAGLRQGWRKLRLSPSTKV